MDLHPILGHGLTFRMTVSVQNFWLCYLFISNLTLQVICKQVRASVLPVPSVCNHRDCNDCWKGYPQSLFPNWTPAQVTKSKISRAIKDYQRDVACIIHYVNVDDNGYFIDAGKYVATESNIRESWHTIVESRVSAMTPFVPMYKILLFSSN
jgi:hypothetical protein